MGSSDSAAPMNMARSAPPPRTYGKPAKEAGFKSLVASNYSRGMREGAMKCAYGASMSSQEIGLAMECSSASVGYGAIGAVAAPAMAAASSNDDIGELERRIAALMDDRPVTTQSKPTPA